MAAAARDRDGARRRDDRGRRRLGAGPRAGAGGAASGAPGGASGHGVVEIEHDAALAGVDPEPVRRLQTAREAAAADGFELEVTSGYRTAAEQRELVARAVVEHGSREEAQRWVLPPEASAHVTGTAIDVGDREAAAWLEAHQEEFGLCRTYANEWWHVEVVGEVGEPCPPMHPDASHGWAG